MDDATWKSRLTAWQLLESAIRDKVNPGEPGDLELAEDALARGADINYRQDGWTALMYAALENDARMAEWLIEHGARDDNRVVMEAARNDASAVLAVLFRHGYGPEWNEHGDSPISLAAREKLYAVIPLLVEAGADVDRLDDNGNSARMYLKLAGRLDLLRSDER